MHILPLFIRRRIANRPKLIKIIDNICWLFFDKVLRMGVGLLVGVWIARYLGPEQFGLFSFATAFVGLFGAVASLGLKGIVVRDIVRNPSCKEETLGSATLLQLLGGLLAYGCVIGSIFWLRPDDMLAKVLVAVLGSIMLFKASEVVDYWFESQVISKYTVWIQNGSFLVFAAFKAALILNNAPLLAFAWATTAEALVVALLRLVILGLHGPGLHQLRVTVKRVKSLLIDSWPLMLSGVSMMIYMKIDQIMLGQMKGDIDVGIYSAAARVSEVWYFIPMMIVASVFPAIIEVKQRNERHYYERLQHLLDLMVWLSVIVAIPITFFGSSIIVLIFGDAYKESGVILSIHIWASVFVFLGVAGGKWFLVENRQILNFYRKFSGAVINIILNFLLIPDFGPIGAAVATIFSYAVVEIIADSFRRETRQLFAMKVRALNLVGSIARAWSRKDHLTGFEK
jgi:O-antigen/teichoic acid export membrane protein